MGQSRIYVTALSVLLIPASVGVLTLHASPSCEKFVRTYVSVPVRNKVSKATAAAWAKWRVAHPNWKPNPAVKRPRFKMSQHEVMRKVDFACQVPTEAEQMAALFPPDALKPPADLSLPPAEVPTIETTDVTVPGTIPPVVAELPPTMDTTFPPSGVVPPFIPPIYGGGQVPPVVQTSVPTGPVTPPVSPVPEPPSLALMVLGLGSGAATKFWRRKKA